MPAPQTNVLSTTIFRSHNYDSVYQSFQILVNIVSCKILIFKINFYISSTEVYWSMWFVNYMLYTCISRKFTWFYYFVENYTMLSFPSFFVWKKLNMRLYRWICILVAICCIWFTMLHLMQKHSLPVQFKIKICTNSLITPLNTLHLASSYMSVQSIENSLAPFFVKFKMLRLKEHMTRKITLTWKISFWRLFVVL